MKLRFLDGACSALLKGLEEAIFFSIQKDNFLYRSGGIHAYISGFKKNAITKFVLNCSAKLLADGETGPWRAQSHSCTSPTGARGPAHQLHTVVHPPLMNCPLKYETSFPWSNVKCSPLSIYVTHSWNKPPVCILVICEDVRGEYRTP